MNICCEILGWLPLDVKKLEDIVVEYCINIDELVKYAEDSYCEKDINCFLYCGLKIAEDKIKNKLKEWLETKPVYDFLVDELNIDVYEKIDKFDANPYADYMCSDFDSCFANFNYIEPTDVDFWELIEGIFDVTENDYKKWLKERQNEQS